MLLTSICDKEFSNTSDLLLSPLATNPQILLWKTLENTLYISDITINRNPSLDVLPRLNDLSVETTYASLFAFLDTHPWKATTSNHIDFLKCLATNSNESIPKVYIPSSTSYLPILRSSIHNLRFASPKTPKPQFITTPDHESQVPTVVICSKEHGFKVTVRSGGHDFEGLSYISNVPFVLIDLANLRKINVDIEDNTAWVQAGATLGELYYRIAEKSLVHGFPAGACPTVAVGGHISGGGFGAMVRKYGVAADYVLDARLVNANGEVLNRETMGRDLFWAIRGGGVASFGVLLAWKIKLVYVPPVVTISLVTRTLEQGATELVHKWQSVASRKVPRELAINLHIGAKQDCIEDSWVKSHINFLGFPVGTPVDILLNRTSFPKATFKAKSDFVNKPIPKIGLEGIWNMLLKEERPELIIATWGGKVKHISEHKIAFPHRGRNMYLIGYVSNWDEKNEFTTSERHISWIRELYDYMTPYVSKSPRTAFLNYRDLDLGKITINNTVKYSNPRIWGLMYFKNNFKRLVKVKSAIDPQIFSGVSKASHQYYPKKRSKEIDHIAMSR
ncbi:hypothetical protein Syun_021976 [Stephania yunnanensis]|uniref:FAD-binding PCMH-type domain-containing protein n=1 Tax=Stephania yunnanensis TaxID=152371 RepID=A0AAP0NR59_9MAGN